MTNEQNKPIELTTESFIKEVVESDIPVVVDFWAPWCGPCRAVGPVLEDLAGTWSGKVKVVKVNVDEQPELAQSFNIRSIPTLLSMRGSNVVDVQVGAAGRPALEKLFVRLSEESGTPAAEVA